MTNRQGEFIWYELMTSDLDRAEAFYGPILGWKSARAEAGADYRLLSKDGTMVGGMTPPTGLESGPAWFGYIGVDDVDATVRELQSAGGGVHVPPTDIPGIGRFALLNDPQGIIFYVMRGASPERSDSFSMTEPGRCRWNELSTSDPAGALAFYGRLGFEKGDVMPMGEMGDYQFIGVGDQMIGAVMKTPPGAPAGWTFYFGVADIDDAARAVAAGGGQVVQAPMEIPGGEYSMVAADPLGAVVGFVGPRRS